MDLSYAMIAICDGTVVTLYEVSPHKYHVEDFEDHVNEIYYE